MATRDTQCDARRAVVFIAAKIGGKLSIHFCGGPLQPGDVWIPLEGRSMFQVVEQALQQVGQAHNLTSISELRQCGESIDYRAIYNEACAIDV